MKKNIIESENFILHNDLKLDKKKLYSRKGSTNINYQKENKIFNIKLGHLESNNPFIPNNIRPKNNLNLLPIKKTRNKKENEINAFSLFFNGDSNFVSSKNEVNLITTQYNYGNNLLLIHKVSKDFSSKKLKIRSFNNINNNNNSNNSNNNNALKEEIEEKLKTHLNIGQKYNKKSKRALILNNLKSRKNFGPELQNIKEIRDAIYESQVSLYQKQNFENSNINTNIHKIANNILTKKLPGLHKKKSNNIDLIDFLGIPPRNKLITPLLQNKSNYLRKKSEISRHKISKKENKQKEEKDMTYGHRKQWKKISLIKESEKCFIYKAFDITNGFIFIVKEYKINNKEFKKNRKLFYNEAKYLRTISQKNVVEFLGAEVVDSIYFYIYLNFIGGYNLKDFYSKVGFFTKTLLKSFILQIIYFLDYMKMKGLVYNNFSFSNIMFDLDGTIKIIDFSEAITQTDIIKNSYARHNDDVDFYKFKDMILTIIDNQKSNNFNNKELSNDICNFCNFLEISLNSSSSLSEFKNNYFCKDKEETIYMKNSSINIIN